MCLQPVLPFTAVGDQGDLELDGVFHFFQNDLTYFFLLVLADVEVEFVVYLKDHFAFQTFFFETVVDAYHRYLDDVGGATLDRGVDRISFGLTAYDGVVRIDVRQVTFAFEYRFDIAFFFCAFDDSVHIFLDAAVCAEIVLDIVFGFSERYSDILRKRIFADTVNYAEIDRLCASAEFGCHHCFGQSEHLRRRCRVNVPVFDKRTFHVFIVCNVRKHTQFYL